MDPIIGASLIGLGGGLLGGAANSSTNAKNIKFQKWAMANAHQQQVGDMKKAGLNPILSATGGAGAKPGGGSSVDVGGSIQKGISSIPSSALAKQTTKKVKEDTRISKNQGDISATQAEVEKLKLKALKAGIGFGETQESNARELGSRLSDAGSRFSTAVGESVKDTKATIDAIRGLRPWTKPKPKLTTKQKNKQLKDKNTFLRNRRK